MPASQKMLVEPPASDATATRDLLGYVEAYDAPNNGDYAYVGYRETDRATGEWRVRIKGHQAAGAVFEQEAMRLKAREMGAQGKEYFTWGFSITPSAGDPRQVEFRVYQKGGKPSEIEMYVRTRKFDQSAEEAKSVRFSWPA